MPPSARRWPLMRWSEVVVEVYILQLHHHHHPPPLPPPPQSITTSHHHRPWTCTVPLTGSRRQTFPGTLCPTFTPPLLPPPQRILWPAIEYSSKVQPSQSLPPPPPPPPPYHHFLLPSLQTLTTFTHHLTVHLHLSITTWTIAVIWWRPATCEFGRRQSPTWARTSAWQITLTLRCATRRTFCWGRCSPSIWRQSPSSQLLPLPPPPLQVLSFCPATRWRCAVMSAPTLKIHRLTLPPPRCSTLAFKSPTTGTTIWRRCWRNGLPPLPPPPHLPPKEAPVMVTVLEVLPPRGLPLQLTFSPRTFFGWAICATPTPASTSARCGWPAPPTTSSGCPRRRWSSRCGRCRPPWWRPPLPSRYCSLMGSWRCGAPPGASPPRPSSGSEMASTWRMRRRICWPTIWWLEAREVVGDFTGTRRAPALCEEVSREVRAKVAFMVERWWANWRMMNRRSWTPFRRMMDSLEPSPTSTLPPLELR